MKIVCISDTHGEHDSIQLPEADMIIHAGDFSSSSLQYDVEGFLNWFSSLNYKYKIFIAGNHDFLFERRPEFARSLIPEGIIYLEETGVTNAFLSFSFIIGGLSIVYTKRILSLLRRVRILWSRITNYKLFFSCRLISY